MDRERGHRVHRTLVRGEFRVHGEPSCRTHRRRRHFLTYRNSDSGADSNSKVGYTSTRDTLPRCTQSLNVYRYLTIKSLRLVRVLFLFHVATTY
jgi:hypothetical protein